MPPANSRTATPPADRLGTPPSSYLSALRQLESPVNQDVLNLAATLTTTNSENGADSDPNVNPGYDGHPDEARLRQLRNRRASEEWRAERSRDRLRLLERQRDELDNRDRLRRVMHRLSRIHEPPAAYGDRVPSQNNLYDWSPSSLYDSNEADDEEELDQILAELRQQPTSQLDTDRDSRIRNYSSRLLNSNPRSHPAESSLRSAAILESVRRHSRISSSARTRDDVPRASVDQDPAARSNFSNEPSERTPDIPGGGPHVDNYFRQLAQITSNNHQRMREAAMEAYGNRQPERPTVAPPSTTPMLEQTIKYLSRIRSSSSLDDSLNHALEAGFLSKDYFCDDHSDFVLDTFSLPPPVETSWLAPGAVLSGCQHATNISSTVTAIHSGASSTQHRNRARGGPSSDTLEPPHPPWLNSYPYSSFTSHRTPSPEVVTTHSPQQDRWPVKVTIHAVDYSKMCLSATMEAYNVPSHPHTHSSLVSTIDAMSQPFTRTSSITTYLEGQILDFNTHTLLTESWKSDASTDAIYWRKLPPFQKYSQDELVRNLTSRKWFDQVLNREWILMRWKEQCFVKSLNRTTSTDHDPSGNASSGHANSGSQPSGTTSSTRDRSTSASGRTAWPVQHNAEHSSFDDSGCGLTISGFYYVCLKRSNGELEGLYFDPQSSPYQCLKLKSARGGVFPAWQFR